MAKLNRREWMASAAAMGAVTVAYSGASAARAASITALRPAAAPDDAIALASKIRQKQISPLDAVNAAIARARALQPKLNFLVTGGFEQAQKRAASATLRGPFAGVPFLIKDLNDIKGLPTKLGSRARQKAKSEEHQGPYMDSFTNAGLVVLGKSATPELGLSPTTEPLAFGPTHNPWNVAHSSGGSSGGSAAAVAARIVPVAHGNDGGGSLRIPASCCGVFGMKLSRGRLIKDHQGRSPIDFAMQHVLSISVRDSAAFVALSESPNLPSGMAPIGTDRPAKRGPLKIAVVYTSDSGLQPDQDVRAAVDDAVSLLGSMGHHVQAAKFPMADNFMDDFTLFFAAGAMRAVARAHTLLGRAPDTREFEPFTLGLAEFATRAGPHGMANAVERLKKAGTQFNNWISDYDVVVSPVLRTAPPKLGYLAPDVPFETLVERTKNYMGYTPIHNISGAPAMSVPLHWTKAGLPIGVQFSAAPGDEKTLFELAYALETARPWANRIPPGIGIE